MELGQTTSMLNKSITETIPEVQALKLENTHIMSKLSEAENENDFLREVNRLYQFFFYKIRNLKKIM